MAISMTERKYSVNTMEFWVMCNVSGIFTIIIFVYHLNEGLILVVFPK
jgi:hypothetical protein